MVHRSNINIQNIPSQYSVHYTTNTPRMEDGYIVSVYVRIRNFVENLHGRAPVFFVTSGTVLGDKGATKMSRRNLM